VSGSRTSRETVTSLMVNLGPGGELGQGWSEFGGSCRSQTPSFPTRVLLPNSRRRLPQFGMMWKWR